MRGTQLNIEVLLTNGNFVHLQSVCYNRHSNVWTRNTPRRCGIPVVTEENWAEIYAAITAEHDEERACEQLAAGWKKWLAKQNPAAGVGAAASAAADGGGGPGSEFLDD